jgi:hypothetical protein
MQHPQTTVSCPAKAGHPVRRSLSISIMSTLEYWITRFPRVTTPNVAFAWLHKMIG